MCDDGISLRMKYVVGPINMNLNKPGPRRRTQFPCFFCLIAVKFNMSAAFKISLFLFNSFNSLLFQTHRAFFSFSVCYFICHIDI